MTGQLVVRISCAVSYALRCRTVESVAHEAYRAFVFILLASSQAQPTSATHNS